MTTAMTGPTPEDGLTLPAAPSVLARRLRGEGDGTRFFCAIGVCMECEEEDAGGRVIRICLEPSRA